MCTLRIQMCVSIGLIKYICTYTRFHSMCNVLRIACLNGDYNANCVSLIIQIPQTHWMGSNYNEHTIISMCLRLPTPPARPPSQAMFYAAAQQSEHHIRTLSRTPSPPLSQILQSLMKCNLQSANTRHSLIRSLVHRPAKSGSVDSPALWPPTHACTRITPTT